MKDATSLDQLRAQAQSDVRGVREAIQTLGQPEIDLILTKARSHYAWRDEAVSEATLRQIFDISIMGPTSMNTCPARILFAQSDAAKQKLAKSLKPANVPKVLSAPVTAIIAYDLDFWTQLPKLFPHEDRRHLFEGKDDHITETAFRNSTLQGAYVMIAARALGLDVGAMSGFDNAVVDQEFFAGTQLRSNFLCNLGYADESALFQRLPRFSFDDVCEIL